MPDVFFARTRLEFITTSGKPYRIVVSSMAVRCKQNIKLLFYQQKSTTHCPVPNNFTRLGGNETSTTFVTEFSTTYAERARPYSTHTLSLPLPVDIVIFLFAGTNCGHWIIGFYVELFETNVSMMIWSSCRIHNSCKWERYLFLIYCLKSLTCKYLSSI